MTPLQARRFQRKLRRSAAQPSRSQLFCVATQQAVCLQQDQIPCQRRHATPALALAFAKQERTGCKGRPAAVQLHAAAVETGDRASAAAVQLDAAAVELLGEFCNGDSPEPAGHSAAAIQLHAAAVETGDRGSAAPRAAAVQLDAAAVEFLDEFCVGESPESAAPATHAAGFFGTIYSPQVRPNSESPLLNQAQDL